MISLCITATFSTLFASTIQKNKIAQITQLIQSSDTAEHTINQKKRDKTVQAYTTYNNARNLNRSSTKNIYTSNSNMPSKPNRDIYIDTKNAFILQLIGKYRISVPKQGRGEISIEEKYHDAFTLSFPNQDETIFTGQGKQIAYNTILYKDTLRVLTVLNNADTPTKYRYKIHIPTEGKLIKLKDGGILILDKNETLFGGFTPPSAIDKKGKKIPTHYEIQGDELIQVIEHLSVNVTYPIIAGSYAARGLIHKAKWQRGYILGQWRWVLSIGLTKWGQVYSGNSLIGVYGFDEVVRGTKIYTNREGLKDQFICKQKYANYRDSHKKYYLNEWRPHIGYEATVQDKCNPSLNN